MALPSKINPPWTLGQARATVNSLIDHLDQGGTSGTGIRNVSGAVNLDDAPGIVQVYATAAATVERVALAKGDAAVFRYLDGAWTHMVAGKHSTWQTAPPVEPTQVVATGPTWTDDPTSGGGSWVTPTQTGVTYSPASGSATPGQSVTVTATAQPGYTLSGTTSWSHTFPSAPAAPPSLTHLDYKVRAETDGTTTFTTHTFTGVNLGTPKAGRLIVLALTAHGRNVTAVTIGGVNAAIHTSTTSAAAAPRGFIASAVVPDGSTGDVTVTYSGATPAASIEVLDAAGVNTTPYATAQSAPAAEATLPATPTGGIALLHMWRDVTTETTGSNQPLVGATEINARSVTYKTSTTATNYWKARLAQATTTGADITVTGATVEGGGIHRSTEQAIVTFSPKDA